MHSFWHIQLHFHTNFLFSYSYLTSLKETETKLGDYYENNKYKWLSITTQLKRQDTSAHVLESELPRGSWGLQVHPWVSLGQREWDAELTSL